MPQRKRVVLNLEKQGQNFPWVCILMLIVAIYSLTEKIYKFKADNKDVDFPTKFHFGGKSEKVIYIESEEYHLKGRYVYDYSIDYNATSKCEILTIHQYLLVKNNAK